MNASSSLSFTSQFGVKAAQADCKCLESRKRIPIIHREHIFADLAELEDDLIVVRLWACRLRSCRTTTTHGDRLSSGGNQLEVLDRGNRHPPPEIQAPALQLFMPTGWLVLENQRPQFAPVCSIITDWSNGFQESGAAELGGVIKGGNAPERVLEGSWEEFRPAGDNPTWLDGRGRDWVHDAAHPTRAPRPENVELIGELGYVVAPGGYLWGYFLGVESPACLARWWHVRARMRRLRVVYYELCAKKIWSAKGK